MNGTGVPSEVPVFKEGDSEVTAFSADVMNTLAIILRAVRNIEIDGYEFTWSEGKLLGTKTDKTRTPETTQSTGGGSLPTWLP